MADRQLVLVAVDRRSNVERTVGVARAVARARGADVLVVEVAPRRAEYLSDVRRWGLASEDPRSLAVGARVASALSSAHDDGRHVRRVTLTGTPEQAIPVYAQLQRATLLVLESTYGSWPFWRSTRSVDEIARRSPAPLLVLPAAQPGHRQLGELRRILAPVDFSVASAITLRTALSLSRRYGARLTLLHAIRDVPRHTTVSGTRAWEVIRRLPARLEAVAERLRRKAASFGAHDVETEVVTGDIVRALRASAARSAPDLIVMGIARRSWLDRIVAGSTFRRVLRRAAVPALIVPAVAGAHASAGEYGIARPIGGQQNPRHSPA